METPLSKSQIRALGILRLKAENYIEATEALTNAGYRGDAIPKGATWRSAGKLSDAELIAGIKSVEMSGDERIEY